MQENEFEKWLASGLNTQPSISSTISNCHRVEKHYGNLDDLLKKNGLENLLEEFKYTREDEKENKKQKHRIPINGNIYNVTASLRNAINQYGKFLKGEPSSSSRGRSMCSFNATCASTHKAVKRSWPKWESVKECESLQFAKVLSKYIKFLSPEVVKAIVDDNKKIGEEFCKILENKNIDPKLYFWEKSSCCFPGIRRAAGSAEVAALRKRVNLPNIEDAICLDDNDFPKQIWSFVFRGTYFNKSGPEGYSLAHLVDHKKNRNRMPDEFDFEKGKSYQKPFYGLYTCASNSVFMPESLILIKEFDPKIRNLLFRRAFDLYGSFCNLVPPYVAAKECCDVEWGLDNFEWSPPVGTLENVRSFLEFRKERLEILFYKS